jgi:hypothetical protein
VTDQGSVSTFSGTMRMWDPGANADSRELACQAASAPVVLHHLRAERLFR